MRFLILAVLLSNFALCQIALGSEEQGDAKTVLLGIPPWTAKNHLLEWSKPAINFIEQESNVKIKPMSAHDLGEYFNRAVYEQYDVLTASLHLALYLIKYHNYHPILILKNEAQQLIITPKGTGIQTLDDFKSGSIWLPHPLTGGSLVAKRELKKRSIKAHVHHVKDHWAVIKGLTSGKAKVGAVLNTVFEKLDAETRQQYREIYRNPIAWQAIIVTPSDKREEMSTIFKPLMGKTPVIDRKVVKAFAPASEETLQEMFKQLDPYLEDMKAILPADLPK